jgi:hypothetical protein
MIVTFWSAGAAGGKTRHARKELKTVRVNARSRIEAREKAGPEPPGTHRVTVAFPAHFAARRPGATSLTERLTLAEQGDVFWVQGAADVARIAASRARKACEFVIFYAFPFNQARTGDDVSACERVRLTRITVLGNRPDGDAPV